MRAMNATARSSMLCLVSLVAIAACGEKAADPEASAAASGSSSKPKGSASAAAASGGASATAGGAASAAASADAPASDDPLATFKDLDLSGFHKIWKGYSVKAPEGATITQGSGGPKISKDKEFGIEFSFADTTLANTADATKECVNYDQRCAVLERTNDLVETSAVYTNPGAKTTYAFHMLVRPGGSLMACKSTITVEDRAKLDVLKKACSSIAKK